MQRIQWYLQTPTLNGTHSQSKHLKLLTELVQEAIHEKLCIKVDVTPTCGNSELEADWKLDWALSQRDILTDRHDSELYHMYNSVIPKARHTLAVCNSCCLLWLDSFVKQSSNPSVLGR